MDWTFWQAQAVLYFRAVEIFLSPSSVLAPRHPLKERSHCRDTDPTPGDDPPGISSMAQTSKGVRMTAANPAVIKVFLALSSKPLKTQTHMAAVGNVSGDPRGESADKELQRN